MQSDKRYERLVKLWISLWEMVLQEKRHLETVTATLQKIIFEKKGYPKFKNWPEICNLGRVNHLAMLAVATVDLSGRDDAKDQIIAAFPQCFSYEEVTGPYPLSLIRAKGRMKGVKEHNIEGGEKHPISYNAIPSWIPMQCFDIDGDNYMDKVPPEPMLPKSIDPQSNQGDIVTWEEKQWVVLEVNENCNEMWVAPAECIAVDM